MTHNNMHSMIVCVITFLCTSPMHARAASSHGLGNLRTSATSLPKNFGKTHFIVGLPAEQMRSVCKSPLRKPCFNEAYFSPHDDLQQTLIGYIAHEKRSISLAMYTFTDKEIAQALIDAHKRGVSIEVVTDSGCVSDQYSKMAMLRDAGITIYIYDPKQHKAKVATYSQLMHNKFVLFKENRNDQALLWTGSFNFTKSARFGNQENVVVLSEPTIIEKYEEQFERLKKTAIMYNK